MLKSLFVESSFESELLFEIPGVIVKLILGLIIRDWNLFLNLNGVSVDIPKIGKNLK